MNIEDSSKQLRRLVDLYADQQLSYEAYFRQRQILLDSIDKHFNADMVSQEQELTVPIFKAAKQVEQKQAHPESKKVGWLSNFLKGFTKTG